MVHNHTVSGLISTGQKEQLAKHPMYCRKLDKRREPQGCIHKKQHYNGMPNLNCLLLCTAHMTVADLETITQKVWH